MRFSKEFQIHYPRLNTVLKKCFKLALFRRNKSLSKFMLEKIYQPAIELGFSIKQSKFFTFYTAFVFLLVVTLFFMAFRKYTIGKTLRDEAKIPMKTSHCQKLSIRQYERRKKQTTMSELKKLQENPQYKQFINDKYDPKSTYNMKKINDDTSEIQFSEEQDEVKND